MRVRRLIYADLFVNVEGDIDNFNYEHVRGGCLKSEIWMCPWRREESVYSEVIK